MQSISLQIAATPSYADAGCGGSAASASHIHINDIKFCVFSERGRVAELSVFGPSISPQFSRGICLYSGGGGRQCGGGMCYASHTSRRAFCYFYALRKGAIYVLFASVLRRQPPTSPPPPCEGCDHRKITK